MSDEARREPRAPKIGLAMAGGASEGAIYEIGALRALDEALREPRLTELGSYVGVSAGGFLAACLANGLSTAQMARAIVKEEPGEHPFVPEIFFQPAVRELGRRVAGAPRILAGALRDYVTRREKRLIDALTSLGQSLPVGVFDNEKVREYVQKIFSIKGRTDDFRRLRQHLVVVATDLESGESALFGEPGFDHVPISRAVQASTALPGLYPPVEIDGRLYVDGILRKTMHASVALDAGAELVFCINPIVPVDTRRAVEERRIEHRQLLKRGLPSVLSQSVRTLIHSRMVLGVRAYEERYPHADVVLLEPRRDDYENFFSNIFSFASRKAVAERAYRATRESLRSRLDELEPVLARHGAALDREVLADEGRTLWDSVGVTARELAGEPPEPGRGVLGDLDSLLDRVEQMVAERRTA